MTMKVILSFVVIAFAAKVNSQQQPQLPVIQFDMNEWMAHQQQHMQHQQAREREHQQMHMNQQMQINQQMHMNQQADEQNRQMEVEGPTVGSPLGLGLMGLKMPFGVHHALGGLGLPGMKFSNFHAGHLGGLHFGNALLGSENPMAEEGAQEYQVEPQLAAPQQESEGIFPFHHHWLLAPHNAEPQHIAPQQHQGFLPFLHFLNDESNLGAAQQMHQQHHQLAAPQMQQFDHQQYQVSAPQMQQYQVNPQQYQVGASPMQQFETQTDGPPMPQHMQMQQFPVNPENMPMVQMEAEDGSRHWWGKKGGDSYGGGYDDSYGNDKGYNKGYNKGHNKGYSKGYDQKGYGYDKGYDKGKGYSKGGYGQEEYGKGYNSYGGGYGGSGGNSYGGGSYGGNSYGGGSYGGQSYANNAYSGPPKVVYQDVYQGYRANEVAVEKPTTVGSEAAKVEVVQLNSTQTSNSSHTTTTTTTEKPQPCEISTKKSNEKSEENLIEKKEETTKKPKSKSSRRRRSPQLGNKRCIGELFGGFKRDSILGASNPNAADCDSAEEDCHPETRNDLVERLGKMLEMPRRKVEIPKRTLESPLRTLDLPIRNLGIPMERNEPEKPEPRLGQPLINRLTQPYMGVVGQEKLWDKNGLVGRFMGPIEDLYFEFMPNQEMVQMMNFDQDRVIT